MKAILIALCLVLALCSVADAQSSISLTGGPYLGTRVDPDRNPVMSGEFCFDLGLTNPGFKFGHLDFLFGLDSLPMVFGGLEWIFEPDPGRVGFWVSVAAGSLSPSSDFEIGTPGFLFRTTVGVIIDWLTFGWRHWSHAYSQGSFNPGLNSVFIGFRVTFGES